MRLRPFLVCVVALLFPAAALAQSRRDAHVVFKDGFHVKGIVNEHVREVIWDRASGGQFPIYSGKFYLNDFVREIVFSPWQVSKVIQPQETKPPMRIVRFDRVLQTRDVLSTWKYVSFGAWSDHGERTIEMRAPKGKIELTQRVGMLTPQYVMCATVDYRWNLMYFTQEFGPDLTRKIILQIFNEARKYKDWPLEKKLMELATFLKEAGWHKEAEAELQAIAENYPDSRKLAEERLAELRKDRAEAFVESLEKAATIGQNQVVLDGLERYDTEDYAKIVSAAHRQKAQDLRAKYDRLKIDMDAMRRFLKELPAHTKNPRVWDQACAFIPDELNHDSAGRLEEFLASAQQLELERKNKRELSQSAEKVLAIGLSGWLQGNQAALPDEKAALKLAAAREFILEYLRSESDVKRASLLSGFQRTNDLSVDVMARLVRMIPPPAAVDAAAISTAVQSVAIEKSDGDVGAYLVQLPPDYHHLRAHPVVILLQSSRDKAEDMLRRFSDDAARHGFILIAPLWGGKGLGRASYERTGKEQMLAVDTLRDARRRFQIDSDRVFLFGWEDGGNMAFDVALAHPDLFAGVAPMNGGLLPFTRRHYWANAQYLPFYVIAGERDGHAAQMKELFKRDWTRDPFACMYVEYKGRLSEWYQLETGKLMDWMNRKKRFLPLKEVGSPNPSYHEEFHSTRSSNNRFYWLRGDGFSPLVLSEHKDMKPGSFRPALFQASLEQGNKIEKGEAKIWNQLRLRVVGVKQVTFLITPGMMDIKYPLQVIADGRLVGGMRKIEPSLDTMLDELYQSGDRQRLYIAKVDVRL